jgi:hypothetical protein
MHKRLWLIMALAAAPIWAQRQGHRSLSCDDSGFHSDNLVSHCEMKEQTFGPSGGAMRIDPGMNGGVSVTGWDKNQVLVRAKIQTAAETDAAAVALVSQIRFESGAGQFVAQGPAMSRSANWSVSYEIFAPAQSDLNIKAHNGGIALSDLRGKIEFSAMNGGVHLARLGGDVHGRTDNGGLTVELAGDHWDGQGMNVETTNGGVKLLAPANYSAHVETSTVNGRIHTDFPTNVQGKIDRELSFDMGGGGATIRVVTTNGGVHIGRS